MHGPSLPAPSGAAGRVQLPIAARCGFCSTFRRSNLPNARRGATRGNRRKGESSASTTRARHVEPSRASSRGADDR